MSFAKFIVIQPGRATRELLFEGGVTSIGRALDNSISLEGDSNVSRYHAEIEKRADGFWITDLGSSNGTTVNDIAVGLDRSIRDGDLIGIGGSSIIEFHLSDVPWEDQAKRAEEPAWPRPEPLPVLELPAVNSPAAVSVGDVMPSTPSVPSIAPHISRGLSPLLLIGAIGGGLLLTGAVAAVFMISRSSACKASVRIISPQNGTTVRGPLSIQVEAEETECIDRVIYQLDGVKVASSEIAPYQAMLDPADLSGLTAGNHVLTVTIEDEKGDRSVQPDEVVLGFDRTLASAPESTTSTEPTTGGNDEPGRETTQSQSATDIKDMCEKLAREVSRKEGYIFDRELLHQVEARTREYAVGGFHGRARPFRDVINDSFINEQGLDPPLGYLVAMSRSNFALSANRSDKTPGEGLWRMPLQLAQDAGYIGRCGTSTLSDPNQKCAAMAAAAYMKALVVDLFFGDTLYAIACFGMNPKEAAQWRDQLPTDRRDLWKVVNSAEQRDRLIRFFAAGIVGENPQQFGLTTDTPLSSLYPKK